MGLHEDVRPRRRARIRERGGGEAAEEAPRASGSPVVSRATQSASVSMWRVMTFWTGRARSESITRTRRASGTASGSRMPAAAARRPGDQVRAGEGEERVPADALPDVVAVVVPELVREDDLDLFVVEAPVEEGVPEDDPPARARARPPRRSAPSSRAHLLDAHRDVGAGRAPASYSSPWRRAAGRPALLGIR